MKKYGIMLGGLLFIAWTVFTSCSNKQERKEELTFAFVPGVVNDQFYYTMERGAREKAQELGVHLLVAEYPTSWSPDAQIPVLENIAASEDIDLILIAPTSVDALIAPLQKIHARGIEIITVDTFLGDGDYSKESDYSFPLSYIGTDNELGGKKIAENLAALLGGKGKLYVNTTLQDVSSVIGRVNGFRKGIAEFPGMEVVRVDYNLDVQQKAREQTLAALQNHPDIVGVFGTNLFSAQGAYQAVVASGLTGAVKIASWDASQELIDALKKGQLDLVLAQKPAEMGALAVEWGYKFFNDRIQIPKKMNSGFEFFTRENVNNPEMQKFVYR